MAKSNDKYIIAALSALFGAGLTWFYTQGLNPTCEYDSQLMKDIAYNLEQAKKVGKFTGSVALADVMGKLMGKSTDELNLVKKVSYNLANGLEITSDEAVKFKALLNA